MRLIHKKEGNKMGLWRSNVVMKNEEMKYTRARHSLLLVVILSIVNLFALVFADMYFLFSSYITLTIGATGGFMYLESGDAILLVVTIILGIISVIPYLVCWIFSKKKVGWLIASLVLFALDTVLLLVDTIAMFDVSYILDLVIHILVIVELVVAVRYGLKKKKEQSEEDTIE